MPSRKSADPRSRQLLALVLDQWKREVANGHLPRISDSLEMLSDEEIWWRPNDASNSLGNIVLHLCGNMRQWVIAGLGGAEDIRERDLEFSEKGPLPRGELIGKLRGTVREASRVIARLSAADLTRKYGIQGYRVTGYEAAFHVATHFTYHAGQIIYVAKMKRAKDLGFTKLPPPPKKRA
jgi:uncharacterized damage-inducible protein DinB